MGIVFVRVHSLNNLFSLAFFRGTLAILQLKEPIWLAPSQGGLSRGEKIVIARVQRREP